MESAPDAGAARPAFVSREPLEAFSPRVYFYTGVALVVAFFSPVAGAVFERTQFSFINIEGLGEPQAPFLIKVELIYPLIAGMAMLAVSRLRAGLGRAFAILIIALGPFLVLFTSQEVAAVIGRMFGDMSSGAVSLSLLSLAPVGIFAASRARVIRPGAGPAAAVGAISGAAYLAGLLIPVGSAGRMPVAAPFDMLSSAGGDGSAALVGALSIAQMIVMGVAAVLCMMNASNSAAAADRRAGRAFNCWLWAFALGALSTIVVGTQIGRQMPAGLLITIAIKVLLWLGALYFLLLAGVTEILVHTGRGAAHATAIASPGSGPRAPISIPAAALDPHERLRRLQQMHAEGLITQEDYERKKTDIIARL